jgi:hypothetical protein
MTKKDLITYSDNVNASLEAPEVDPKHLILANELLSGKSIPKIAEEYGLTNDQVSSVVERGEVKRYIDSVYMSQGYLHRSRRLQIINEVIDEKMAEARETGVFSKRDLLEWLKLLNDMERDSRPKTPTTAVQVNNQTNNYSTLMQDLFDQGGKQ